MRRICTGLLAAALTLGLLAAQPAQAKVYKMDPEERAAALKEKKAKRAKAKKSGKAAPEAGQGQGGWVEVKPGEKIAKKNKKSSKVDDIAQAAEQKGKKKKSKAADESLLDQKPAKKSKKAEAEPKPEKKADKKADKKTAKKGRKSASHGDRVVGSNYGGERKVSGTSAEVRRPDAPKSDDLNAYSVSRPGQDKAAAPAPAAPVVPEVRHEVQPGPLDTSKPLGTEQKAGEGRF